LVAAASADTSRIAADHVAPNLQAAARILASLQA
jgi:hypothetical protein